MQAVGTAQQFKNLHSTPDREIAKSNGPGEESTVLIDIEDEDEEHYNWKPSLLAQYILAFSFALLLSSYFNDHSTDRLPLFRHLFYLGFPRYIVQRVIRI
jgi:hypothetical protein